MNSPDPPAQPDDASLISNEAEVEKLLQQAENLVGEIVETAGVSSEAVEGSATVADVVDAQQPDPLAAVQEMAARTSALEAAVDDLAPIVESAVHEAEALSTEVAVSPGEPLTEAMVDETIDEAAEQAITSVEAEPAVESESQIEVASSADEASELASRDVNIPPESPEQEVVEVRRWTWRRVMTAALLAPPRALGLVFVLLDRPFSRVPDHIKFVLGVVGLISLLMGGVAFMAPKMFAKNPYAEMKPHREAAAEAAGGGASHGEAAPSGGGGHH